VESFPHGILKEAFLLRIYIIVEDLSPFLFFLQAEGCSLSELCDFFRLAKSVNTK